MTQRNTASTSNYVATTVDHPRLVNVDAPSIRVFLRAYDQYATEVTQRAKQLVGDNFVTSEVVTPVNLKFCVDAEWLESMIELDFIEDVDSYDGLSDGILRAYLEKKAETAKDVITMSVLDEIVRKDLRMNMHDANATSRIESVFVGYHQILRRNGLSWIVKDNQKVAVSHVLSAIRPLSLRTRLESDLELSHHELKKNFKGFMKHAIRLSEAFQLVDIGKPNITDSNDVNNGRKGPRSGDEKKGPDTQPSKLKSSTSDKSELPICLYGPHKAKGYRHLLKDCTQCPEQEKKELLKARAEEKYKTGPARSTRSQTALGSSSTADKNAEEAKKVTGRIQPSSQLLASPSFQVNVMDGTESMTANGRTDDGSDESIVSSRFAEKAVLNGIGKMTKIDKVSLQVALKEDETAQSFTFSRRWTPPRTVLRLVAGPLALVNVTFLVADADLAVEDLLIGLPVLQHLGVDTKSLLENKRDVLNGTDCSTVKPHITGGHVSRLMIARLNRMTNEDFDARPRVNYYDVRDEEDPFPDKSLLDPVDSSQHDEIAQDVEKMVQTAVDNGFPDDNVPQLKKIVNDHMDIFRTSFSSGPPANIEPLQIDVAPDATPVRVRLRKYSQAQREFLSRTVAKLVECDMAYPNPTSPWACAPLLVPKPGQDEFRFTVDLRPINRFTVKHQFPMPVIEQELTKVAGSQVFATFDLSHGYWQLPLHPSSQSSQSFITPDGVYSPTRVLHGTTNAVLYLQSTLSAHLPADLRRSVLLWLDDILAHAPTTIELLTAIRLFFELCSERNLKLHPAKCVLYSRSIRWCGRVITADGIRFDPRRIDGIQNMDSPTTGAQLQQFVCAMQWMRSAIPTFTTIIRPLSDFLEIVYDNAGKRTKLAVTRVQLRNIGWGKAEDDAFENCKQALEHQTTLAHRNDSCRLCVYTDACDLVWSGIVTQVPPSDISKTHDDQRHQPLAFLSGRFTGPQLGWSTLEKEAFAIMATVDRMHWVLATPDGFDLFTDHHNLIFLFDPLAVVPDMSQTSLRKVLRWAVRLSMYNYTCVHIKGVDNVWADLLGRWSVPSTIRRLVHIPVLPSSSAADFDWPDPSGIADEQQRLHSTRPQGLIFSDGLWRNEANAVWIPDDCDELQLRLCVIAHTGPSGHRGASSTESTVRQHFFWPTMKTDVDTFVKSCIHCLSTTGGGRVPRPYGPAFHGTSANDLLQFDYIEVAPSTTGDKYVLMLRDDHSDYKWFFAFADTSAENAAHAIVDWCAAFGVPKSLMSDGPTHFKNETLNRLSKGLKVPHHFTLPYTPWSNGAVERLGKELLRVFRSITSELLLRPEEWPDLLPIVQSALNNAPSPQRRNIPPVTAFTGLDSSPPIATFIRSSTTTPMTISDVARERAVNLYALQTKIAELHPLVQESLESSRKRIRESSSRGKLPKFAEGDFVLVARDDFTAGEKLSLRWRGPRRVVKAVSDYVFQVEDLRNGQLQEVHGTRLKFYRDSSLNTEAVMSHVVASETGMPVQRLMRLVDTDDGLMVQVRWRGLPDSEDTLEPASKVYEDVPQLFRKLLGRQSAPVDLVAKARRALRL